VRLQQDTYDLLVTDAVDQRQQLGEVVAVAAGERDRQRLARRRATRARSALADSNPAAEPLALAEAERAVDRQQPPRPAPIHVHAPVSAHGYETAALDEPQQSPLTLGSLPLQPNCASLARGDGGPRAAVGRPACAVLQRVDGTGLRAERVVAPSGRAGWTVVDAVGVAVAPAEAFLWHAADQRRARLALCDPLP
jgi:hypothetical protein